MSGKDGRIYEFDRDVYMDGLSPVKTWRRTIWEEHGTGQRKHSQRLRIKIKTGSTINGSAYLRWADDGAEEWSEYLELELHPIGKRDFIIDLSQMGVYESRRYEFSITDDADIVVVWADETIVTRRV